MQSNFIYGDITEKIIGCAMQVHSFFGLGFPELIYKRSLIIELENAGIKCKSEFEKDIFYVNSIGTSNQRNHNLNPQIRDRLS